MEYLQKPEFDDAGLSTKDVVEMFTYYKEMGSILQIAMWKPSSTIWSLGTTTIALQKKHWIRVSECLIAIWCFTILVIIWITDASSADDRPEYQDRLWQDEETLQFDKLDGERKGIIRKIAEEGQIVAQLRNSSLPIRYREGWNLPKFVALLWYVDHQGYTWFKVDFGHS